VLRRKGANGSFVHLHTEFSMLDGAARLDDLFAESARMGMPALAMTDHGNVFGAFPFTCTSPSWIEHTFEHRQFRRTARRPVARPPRKWPAGRVASAP
jgi:hypothetical protein